LSVSVGVAGIGLPVAHDAGARLSQISVREREYFAHPSVQLAALNEVSKLRESRCSHGDEDEFRTYTMVRGQFLAGSATADTRIPPGRRTSKCLLAAMRQEPIVRRSPLPASFDGVIVISGSLPKAQMKSVWLSSVAERYTRLIFCWNMSSASEGRKGGVSSKTQRVNTAAHAAR
jgi:hypothetical protein